nr:ribonuclease H-like domain-containing protein [Tanacetum cinerariifolium]
MPSIMSQAEGHRYIFQYHFGKKAKPGRPNFTLNVVLKLSTQPLLALPEPESTNSPPEKILEESSTSTDPPSTTEGRLPTATAKDNVTEAAKDLEKKERQYNTSLDFSFRRVPRGGVEQEQFDELSVRKVIDDKSLPDVDSKTRWIKYVPIKVNVYAWKVKTNSLQTRFNVSRRDNQSLLLRYSRDRYVIEEELKEYEDTRITSSQVCFYMHDPREPHFSALKRILRYVQGTLDYGLQLFSSTTDSLIAYSDADWRQPTLSHSNAEAEYCGVANAVVAETCWIRNLLRELHTPLSSATIVYCDN